MTYKNEETFSHLKLRGREMLTSNNLMLELSPQTIEQSKLSETLTGRRGSSKKSDSKYFFSHSPNFNKIGGSKIHSSTGNNPTPGIYDLNTMCSKPTRWTELIDSTFQKENLKR